MRNKFNEYRRGPQTLMLMGMIATLSSTSGQMRRPLIAVAGIMHESNSFNSSKTELSDFSGHDHARAEDLLESWSKSNNEVSGYIEGARSLGLDLFPVFFASATPKGPVTDAAYDTLTADLIARLRAAPKLDGLLLALHGAMVTESHPQADEETVRRLRQALGPNFPIVVTHDFHANISPETVKLSTALITYKQNPHLDTRERGVQAARIMAAIARGEIRPVQAIAKPPMMYNIVFQSTYQEPLLPIVEETRRLEKMPKILAASVSGGYQYGDVRSMGPSVIVVTDNDPDLAQREAQRLSDMLWATRDRIVLHLPDAAAAVRDANASDKFPVALFDFGDNIGGGSAGDSTFILEELVRQKVQGWVAAIADPEAVQNAVRAGIGQRFDMAVGGKKDQMHGRPVRISGTVKSLHDGHYIETEVRHGGGRYHELGLAAVIEAEGGSRDVPNLLLVTTLRSSPNSLHQLISCGIYPQRQRILVVKGTIAPRAAYEPIAARIIGVDTGGATAVNPARFQFHRVRRPLFGIE